MSGARLHAQPVPRLVEQHERHFARPECRRGGLDDPLREEGCAFFFPATHQSGDQAFRPLDDFPHALAQPISVLPGSPCSDCPPDGEPCFPGMERLGEVVPCAFFQRVQDQVVIHCLRQQDDLRSRCDPPQKKHELETIRIGQTGIEQHYPRLNLLGHFQRQGTRGHCPAEKPFRGKNFLDRMPNCFLVIHHQNNRILSTHSSPTPQTRGPRDSENILREILIFDQIAQAILHHLRVDHDPPGRQVRRFKAQIIEQALHNGM